MVKEDENFLRVSLLLLKGGTLVSKETLNIEVNKSGKSIDDLLKPFKKKLYHKTVKRQREKLYPESDTGTNIEVWDIAMLVNVLLTVFKNSLDDDQKDHLKTIKNIRDEVYAHNPSSALSNDEYDSIRGQLEKAYLSLSSSIGNDKKNECDDIIKECTNDPISPEDLKRHLENQEDLFQVVLYKMKEHEKNIREMKDAILAKLGSMERKEDRSIKKIKVIDTELTLSGAVNEKDDIDFAERIVTTIINKAIKKAGGDKDDYPKIRQVVEKMLEDIKDLPEVEVLQAVHKCIILKVECKTYAGLHSILVYLHSDAFKSILKELAVSLNTIPKLKGKQIKIDADVTLECLKNIFDTLNSETSDRDRTIYKRTIRMPIEVKTEEGRRHLWSLFENGGATNRLNELSEAVFEELHTRITVTPSVGSREIEDVVRQTDELYWTLSVKALAVTKNAMSELVKSTFKQFYDELTYSEKRNISNLLDLAKDCHKYRQVSRVKGDVWKVNSPDCVSLLNKLVKAHWNPRLIAWENIENHNEDDSWKIAKLFMPCGNKASSCPEDTDMLAIFQALMNFRVDNFSKERKEINEMIFHRNELLHSPNHNISKARMNEIFENIFKFMESPKLDSGTESKTRDQLRKLQSGQCSNSVELYQEVQHITRICLENESKWDDEIVDLFSVIEGLKGDLQTEKDYRERAERETRDLAEAFKLKVTEYNKDLSKIKEEVEKEHPDKRIFAAATTGGVPGLVGGPLGAVGGTVGGAVVGGTSSFWNKIRQLWD